MAGLVTHEQAEAILAEIGQVTDSAIGIWRRLRAWGSHLAAPQEGERAQASSLPERWQTPIRAD